MGREKRKTRLNKGEATEFIGFGAFTNPAAAPVTEEESTDPVVPSAAKGLSLAPVYLGSESQLSLLFPRIGQKRDATTNTKALQDLRDYFMDDTPPKKSQVDALAHFLYLYQSKLHYDNTPRVRTASLECCQQALLRVPKAFYTLVSQQKELVGMMLCGRADGAADVRKAAQLMAEALDKMEVDTTTTIDEDTATISTLIDQGMWEYVQRILSYGKPLAMHQELFQKKSQQQADSKLSDKHQEELDEKFVRIVGTALSGLQIHLQQQYVNCQAVGSASVVPSLPNAEDARYLWKTLASPKAALRRKTYTLLSTCCQQATSLVDPAKLSNILTQNLSSEKEPTNVKILLETLLAFVASVPPNERTDLLGQYTKALTKLFSRGCHGATEWAPTVLPIVALLPADVQPTVLTSVWQGKSNLVGSADQLEVVGAVAETATFLLLKQSHELAEVLAKCWLQALQTFVTRSIGSVSSASTSSTYGPIPRAYDQLGQILAKDMRLLDTARDTKPNSAMVFLDEWFWDTEIPKVLVLDEVVDLVQLTNLVQRFPSSNNGTDGGGGSGDSHFPKLWKQLFHQYLQQCQASAGLVPGQDIYDFWMVLLQRISVDELFIDVNTMETFLMNDLLRWMVVHTSSLSDQFSESLTKYDFQLYQKCRNSQGGKGTWEAILRELVAAKAGLEALVSGLLILTSDNAGLDSVRSTILDDLCRQVAKESIIELHGEDSEEEFSDATELHLHYHRKASDLLQACVGLGEIDGVLVDASVVSDWIDMACPADPSTTRGPNPVLETLVSLVKNNYLKETTDAERILIQAWRQGGDLWRETVLPWTSKNISIRASVIQLASKELQCTLRQASSDSEDVDSNSSHQWSEQAVRLFELCQSSSETDSELPLPSLDIVGLAAPIWDYKAVTRKTFASQSLLYVMELLEDLEGDACEYRWKLFANSTSTDQDQLLIMVLLHLSSGSKNLLLAAGARRRQDDSAVLLALLGGKSISEELRDRWLKTCLSVFLSILGEDSEELVCRAVSVLSQLVSVGFPNVRLANGSDNKDKLESDQIRAGDSVWYITDAENPKLRETCTIAKVHNDLPSEVYFTIKVERDGKLQERQTVADRLRSSPFSSNSTGTNDEVVFADEIDSAEVKRRQKASALLMDNLVLSSWDKWRLHEYEIMNVLISQLGLLGTRGIGSMHYTVFQKLLSFQSNLVGKLDDTSSPNDFPANRLWSLAFALGYGCNTPLSSWNASLIGFDPESTVDALMRLLDDELAPIKVPSLEVVRPTIAMLTVSLPVLQKSEKLESAKSLVYQLVERSLKEATKKGNGFVQDDYIALRAMDIAQDDHEVNTESDAVIELVGSFASRWESNENTETWAEFPICASVLDTILSKKPRLAGMAGRKHGDSLAAALYVDSKRWLAFRFLEAYAQQKKPIHDSPANAMNKLTKTRLKTWSKGLVPEEAEELEEDIEIACKFIPKGLMNDVESWQDESKMDFHVNENDAFGRLTSWLAYLRIADTAGGLDSLNRTALNSYTRKCGAAESILGLAIMYANVSTDRKVKLQKVDNVDELCSFDGRGPVELPKLACAVIFRTVEVFPTLAKNWWEMSCPNYFRDAVREFVESNVSPELLRRELRKIKAASSFGDMTVKGSLISREVTALYSQDDFTLSVVIKLPTSFPFRRAEVDCSKTLGVPESRWKRWALQITQMLNNQGGSLTDALLLWKENVDKEFEGIEPCPVCYSVLHVKTHKLPEMQCKTCQNRFHFDCLTQWFRSSGKSACVICQQPWSGTRV